MNLNQDTVSFSLFDPKLDIEYLSAVGASFGRVADQDQPAFKPSLPKLTYFYLSGSYDAAADADPLVTIVEAAPELDKIVLMSIKVNDELGAALRKAPKLRKVDCVHCQFASPDLEAELKKHFGAKLTISG